MKYDIINRLDNKISKLITGTYLDKDLSYEKIERHNLII